jgi:GTP-binding protein Era
MNDLASDQFVEWPGEPDDEIEAGLMFDDASLPPEHRSGFIAVVGRPNVGKSTLMNIYLGQKIAIVSSKAQTTRNRLLGILTLEKAQLIFVDTPGIHDPHHKFGEYMVEVATGTIPDADLILWLVDGSEPPVPEDQLVVDAILSVDARPPVILAMNKIDLLRAKAIQPRLAQFLALLQPDLAMPVSALQGDNRDELFQALIDHLPLGPRFFPEDQITDQQTRFIAAELIREAALKVLHQEVPHALAVLVNEFKRRPNNMIYISANIFIERDSQKGIIIGKGGKTLKKIGQLARPEIEELVETKVFLDLRVKVRPKWRKKKEELERLGYSVKS